jgi:hypothetical protein
MIKENVPIVILTPSSAEGSQPACSANIVFVTEYSIAKTQRAHKSTVCAKRDMQAQQGG